MASNRNTGTRVTETRVFRRVNTREKLRHEQEYRRRYLVVRGGAAGDVVRRIYSSGLNVHENAVRTLPGIQPTAFIDRAARLAL
jgi:hypothetical protein